MYWNNFAGYSNTLYNDIYDEETDNCYNLKSKILLLILLLLFVYIALIACALICN